MVPKYEKFSLHPICRNMPDTPSTMRRSLPHTARRGSSFCMSWKNWRPGAEERVAEAFGKELYQELKTQKKEGAREILIHKKTKAPKIREYLADICKEPGPGGDSRRKRRDRGHHGC